MFEIRLHGRGGQGVVTAAELLSIAAFREGKHAQAFPSFGSERTGAPVAAYCRIADSPIRLREPIADPDALIIQDPTLVHSHTMFDGLKKDGFVIINSTKGAELLGLSHLAASVPAGHFITVPATDIARTHIGRPIPNVAMLGAFAAMTGAITLEALTAAIKEKFPKAIADKNIAAANAAFAIVTDTENALVLHTDEQC
jgi:pyruvate ferredoxin oxidoreductase gamma subunit